MARRKERKRGRQPAATSAYSDAEGNVLTLRQSLSGGTIAKIRRASGDRAAATVEDVWHRRTEMLFERLAVSWEIAGMPITEQAMLIGRYRMADAETQRWVRATIDAHLEKHIPELLDS